MCSCAGTSPHLGWESLCTHPTLFSACVFLPCDQEVSCTLFAPPSPHSTWPAASHRSLVLLFPVQKSSVALHGHLGHGCHLLSGNTSSQSLVSKCLSYAQCYGYPRARAAQASQELCSSSEQREQETATADGAFTCQQSRVQACAGLHPIPACLCLLPGLAQYRGGPLPSLPTNHICWTTQRVAVLVPPCR